MERILDEAEKGNELTLARLAEPVKMWSSVLIVIAAAVWLAN